MHTAIIMTDPQPLLSWPLLPKCTSRGEEANSLNIQAGGRCKKKAATARAQEKHRR